MVSAGSAAAETTTVIIRPPIELAPSRLGTVIQDRESDSPLWCPLRRGGRAILPNLDERVGTGGTEIAVGVARRYDPGTPPFPCPETWSGVAVGRAAFDLPHVTNVRLASARLHFLEIDKTVRMRAPERCNVAVGAVGAMTGPWLPGLFAGNPREGVPVAVVLAQPAGMRSVRNIDVTEMVQRWFERSIPNHGLAMIGVQDQVRDRNMHCATFVHGVRLTIHLQGGCPAGTLWGSRRCF
jgi:hypothetical protein